MSQESIDEDTPLLKETHERIQPVGSGSNREDSEEAEEKRPPPYPKSVAFIVSNEFCERFNYYGMRAILVLYLINKLHYSPDTAIIIFHIFTCLVYLFPIFGAILADSWMGRFRTIFYLSIVYSIGGIVVTAGAVPMWNLPVVEVTIIGLVLIAMGTGGIKPCVSAFGGEQFKMPDQAKQLATFFSLFYFAINAGSLLSIFLTPILREEVHCFGENTCFSLAFGVPAILMIVSVVIFAAGKSLYLIRPPSANMIVRVFSCILEAIKSRDSTNPRPHWLDHAVPRCGVKLVADSKALLKILMLYLPLPIFWTLFDQQGSRWTLQANRMVGDMGIFTILPDQMQVINPLLILIFIPIFNYGLYPLLERVGIKRPLQKMTIGGLLAAAAFMLSSFVELKLEQTYPELPAADVGQLRLFNGMPCQYNFTTSIPSHTDIVMEPMSVFEEKRFVLHAELKCKLNGTSDNEKFCPDISSDIVIRPDKALSYFLKYDGQNATIIDYIENPEKPTTGSPHIRVLVNVPPEVKVLTLMGSERTYHSNDSEMFTVDAGRYELSFGSHTFGSTEFRLGGVYVLMVQGSAITGYRFHSHVLVEPNSVSMLWQLPQYSVITAAEIMFSVTGLEFSFTQAPNTMKSVLQACWLLTVSIGNMLVVVIAEMKIFQSQAAEFALFAILMVVDMAIFILLSLRYTYVEDVADNEIDGDKNEFVESQSQQNGQSNQSYVSD